MLNAGMMGLYWYKILLFSLISVGLASSQNATPGPGKLKIVNITASSNRLYHSIHLKCEVQGSPSPHVWWTKNNSDFNADIDFENDNRTLVITGAQVKDIGTYYCHARNSLFYVNASFMLNLIGFPFNDVRAYISILGQSYPLDNQVELYRWLKDFYIECYGLGYPNVQVAWKHVPQTVLDTLNSSRNARVYERTEYTVDSVITKLYFREVYCSDAGTYTCETSIEGYNYIAMDSIKLICNNNFNLSAPFGPMPSTTTTPTSHVTASSSNSKIRLISKFITSATSLHYSQPISLSSSASLSISSVSNVDVISSSSLDTSSVRPVSTGSTSSPVRHLTPTPSRTFNSSFFVRTIPSTPTILTLSGQSTSIAKNVSVSPSNPVNATSSFTTLPDFINSPTLAPSSAFYSLATSSVRTTSYIPLIVLHTNTSKYILEGTGIVFTCQMSALITFPSGIVRMELLKDDTSFYQWPVQYSSHFDSEYRTTLYSAKQNLTGKYQCKATAGASTRYSAPFYLAVGIPSGPVVLEGEPETSPTGIRLSWKPISKQFWNGEEITFQVNVTSLDYTLEKSYVTKTTSVIISGLLPATKYIVDITGKTVFGPTKNRTVVVKTKENFDRCGNADSNSCHEYATCKDVEVGTYICTCFEGFFGDGKDCQGPPQIISKSPMNILEDVETNVTLVCTVIADPNPITVWKHIDVDGKIKEIKRTSDKFDGNYTIHNARVKDSGTYLCNASNTLGYDFYTVKIRIEPVIVNISVEINLSNKTFSEELKNESSPAFIELKNDVYIELYNFFNNTPGFEDIEILGFVNGSVKVLFKVIVKVLKPSKETDDVVAVKVGKKIYKQLKTGRIGKFTVIPSTLKLNAKPPPPANVSYSDVRETKVDIFWYPPELHELFSIERYYISYLKHGDAQWSNDTVGAYVDDLNKFITFQLDNLESDTFYTLKVTAENKFYLGQDSKRMEIKTLKDEVVSHWYYVGPIIAVVCIALLVAVACFVRRHSFSNAWRPVGDGKHYSDTKEEKTRFQMMEQRQKSENTFTNPAFSNTFAKPSWQELQRTSIELSSDTLNPGKFGIRLVRGTFSCILGKNKEACSVKMLKENGTEEDRRELMNELKTISTLSGHENIVNLIGACTSEDGPLLLVFELCSRGTLESNLRESGKSKEMFLTKNKLSLANDVAKGMRHLTESRIIHRDLAARSVMMTADFTPKIFNFGRSHDVYEQSIYLKLTPGKFSTRWLAIESLTDGVYTTKSDVWSFAVVMWEIETEGDIPYQEYEVTEVVNQLRKGHRLPQPNNTSNEKYKLMLQCWDENPDNRPAFEEIVEIIQTSLL